ncbi:MAG: acyltransferase [Solobacterium sp.]|jgi:surface polysaccharide O-acyltransferase-like enzyme|nr:acyltransferase [Solobacterium sp.]
MMNQKQGKLGYLSTAGVVAALAVVFMHVNGSFWQFDSHGWGLSNVIESVSYFAVPVFFMITGVTLMDFEERYDLKTYFRKRIHKIVIPYVIWTLFGLLFHLFGLHDMALDQVSFNSVVKGFMDSSIVPIFWFFPALFTVYLSLPLFAAVQKEKRVSIFSYLVIAGFIFNSLIPFLCSIFHTNWNVPISVQTVADSMLYVLIGWLIGNAPMKQRTRNLIYLAGIAGLCMHLFGTYHLSMRDQSINQMFKGYGNVPCVLYSTAVFTWLRTHGDSISKTKIIRLLQSHTYDIYLIHWFVLNTMIHLFDLDIYSIWFKIIMPFAVTAVSVLLAKLIRRIPAVGSTILP